MATQFKLVIGRANQSMWRSTEYISSKIGLHIGSALVNSLTFLQLDNSVASLQNRLFSVFQGMFIAPGLLNQMQPRFLHKRMLFEAREKQSKMYHWFPFVVGELVAEAPWLIICGTIYYLLWYFVSAGVTSFPFPFAHSCLVLRLSSPSESARTPPTPAACTRCVSLARRSPSPLATAHLP